MKRYWLMKTEPEVFSFDDLVAAPKRTTAWEGVRNYQARNFMRDLFRLGDEVFIYHSNIEEPAVFGVAEVVREAYPDPMALEPKSKYYDEAAKKKAVNPWVMVDVRGILRFKLPVTRAMMQSEPRLSKIEVLRRGSRLSIQPVTPEEFRVVSQMGTAVRL